MQKSPRKRALFSTWSDIVRIDYKKLTIRNAEAADAGQLASWWNDGAVMAHAGFPLGLGISEEKIISDLSTDTDESRRRLILEIEGEAVGEMSYRNLKDGSAEIGIKICNSSRQEKGHGRVFLSMLIGELFERGYEKIVLDTNLQNKRAQHVYESLGFRKLRVNIDSWKDQLGNRQSSVDYELLPGDFVDHRK